MIALDHWRHYIKSHDRRAVCIRQFWTSACATVRPGFNLDNVINDRRSRPLVLGWSFPLLRRELDGGRRSRCGSAVRPYVD
jgi:hypothetical protein